MAIDIIDEGQEGIEENEKFSINDFPDSINIIEEGDSIEEDPSITDMRNKLAQLEANNASLQSSNQQNQQLAQALEKINSNITPKVTEDALVPEEQLDLKAIIANVDKNLVLKPGETLMNALAPIVQKLEKNYENKLSRQDKELGKLSIYQNEEHKVLYNTYKDEVDSLAKKHSGIDSYKKAIQEVQLNHSEDILSAKLAGMKESLLAELKAEMGTTEGGQSSNNAPYTNASRNLNSGKKSKGISRQNYDIVKEFAFKTAGFFNIENDPEAFEVAREMAEKKGLLK